MPESLSSPVGRILLEVLETAIVGPKRAVSSYRRHCTGSKNLQVRSPDHWHTSTVFMRDVQQPMLSAAMMPLAHSPLEVHAQEQSKADNRSEGQIQAPYANPRVMPPCRWAKPARDAPAPSPALRSCLSFNTVDRSSRAPHSRPEDRQRANP